VRFVTCLAGSEERAGLIDGDDVRLFPTGVALVDLLGDLHGAPSRLTDASISLSAATLLAPIPRPPTVRDFYAFEQHVATARRARGLDMEPDWYELPVFYFSNPYATVGPGASVRAPPGCEQFDYELEVAAIVGRGGGDLTPDEAEAHIAGYCILNDWSARDLQRREMKLSLGPAKGKDFATTLGPYLVTPDELESVRAGKAFDLTMTAAVNGREYSRASLADIHWSFGELIAYASRGTRVERGDVIGSGTCGTGCILELSLVHGSGAYPWLQPGDLVELAVDRLGSVSTHIG
jgi:2-keto-4-pentenoate hydratase/2-oxohepta-3-ene-1,7-dioic acid hydratase in catechol pathway